MAYCPNCGRPAKPTANFCAFCGQALRGAPAAVETTPVKPSLPPVPARSSDDAPPSAVAVGRNPWTFEPSAGPVDPPFLPTPLSSGADAPIERTVTPNPWKMEPVAAGRPPVAWNQASPSSGPGRPANVQPGASPSTASGQRGKLLFFALLLAAAGLALILLVAPELTVKWTWLWNSWEETTPEYWMAMVGGGVCLLLAGIFLLKAMTLPDKRP